MTNFAQMFFIIGAMCSPLVLSEGTSKLRAKTTYHLKTPSAAKAQQGNEDKDMVAFTGLLNAPGHVSVEEVSLNLVSELKSSLQSGANHSRILKWQAALGSLFASLEKNAHGNLDQASARYVLHRAFERQHGWYMTGLEPRSFNSLKEWVPSYLLNLVEELLGTKGINLKELAILAATLEDLVHKEAIGRLKEIYDHKHLPVDGYITDQIAEEVIQTYMAIYTSAEDLTNRSAAALEDQPLDLGDAAQVWLRDVQRNVTASHSHSNVLTSDLDVKAIARIIEQVGEDFSTFNNKECKALKSALLEVEDPKHPGQVRLHDFYKKGLDENFWTFDESIEYLRVLGALDESTRAPRVIVSNYISSETNCLTASSFYKSCCRSECEDLMEHLEREINAPTATPGKIAQIVAGLPSDGVAGPGALSATLANQLLTLGDANGGQVSLHSRAFAQWMHDAFPRECPVPHLSLHPQTPDEWLAENGAEGSKASKEDRLEHVERASYEEEQMPWNLDPDQCPLPDPYVLEHTQEVDVVTAKSQTRPKMSLNMAQRLREAEVSKPKETWHMYEVPQQTPSAQEESSASYGDVPERTAEAHVVLPRSFSPLGEKPPDADAMFHQAYDTPSSQEDEVVPMGKAQLPAFENFSDPATRSTSFSHAFVSGLQKNSFFVFLTVILSAALGLEKMRKRNDGWAKRNEDQGYRYGDIDMGLVRMAAAQSASQRYKTLSSQDMV